MNVVGVSCSFSLNKLTTNMNKVCVSNKVDVHFPPKSVL